VPYYGQEGAYGTLVTACLELGRKWVASCSSEAYRGRPTKLVLERRLRVSALLPTSR
jgi:hypothetical protein